MRRTGKLRGCRTVLLCALVVLFPVTGAAGSEDWPEADCDLSIEPSPTWAGLLTDISALCLAEVALNKAKPECHGLHTDEIVSSELVTAGHCRCDDSPECVFEGLIRGRIRVDTQPHYRWGPLDDPAAQFWETHPEKCEDYDTAITASWASYKELKLHLDCWTAGYLDSNYERLETLQDEVVEAEEDLGLIYSIFLEQSLHRYGGSIPASLYLPGSSGGELTAVAELVEEVARKTEAVGYRLDSEVIEILQLADQSVGEGQFKEAVRRYRLAYDKITVQSTELQTGATR